MSSSHRGGRVKRDSSSEADSDADSEAEASHLSHLIPAMHSATHQSAVKAAMLQQHILDNPLQRHQV